MRFSNAGLTSALSRSRRRRLRDLPIIPCCPPLFGRRTRPEPVSLKRLAAARIVFILGMIPPSRSDHDGLNADLHSRSDTQKPPPTVLERLSIAQGGASIASDRVESDLFSSTPSRFSDCPCTRPGRGGPSCSLVCLVNRSAPVGWGCSGYQTSHPKFVPRTAHSVLGLSFTLGETRRGQRFPPTSSGARRRSRSSSEIWPHAKASRSAAGRARAPAFVSRLRQNSCGFARALMGCSLCPHGLLRGCPAAPRQRFYSVVVRRECKMAELTGPMSGDPIAVSAAMSPVPDRAISGCFRFEPAHRWGSARSSGRHFVARGRQCSRRGLCRAARARLEDDRANRSRRQAPAHAAAGLDASAHRTIRAVISHGWMS